MEFLVIFCVLLWLLKSFYRLVAEMDIRKMELRNQAQTKVDSASDSDIQVLLAEIARLRETTTQHAMSLQHTVERLDQRVEFLERKSISSQTEDIGVITPEPRQSQQIVGR